MAREHGHIMRHLFPPLVRLYTYAQFRTGDLLRLLKKNDYSHLHFEKDIMPRGYFEATNICNAACVFCAYRKVKQPKGVMDFKLFTKAVDDYHSIVGDKGTLSFTPTVGDPLVDPQLLKKIDYALSKGFRRVIFYTNGILLNKDENYKRLIDTKLHMIELSVPGFDKKEYERVYQVKRYDDVLTGIHNLLRYNVEQGEPVKIVINFRSMHSLAQVLAMPDYLKYIKPFLSDRVFYTYLADFDTWGGMIPQEELLGVMKTRAVPKVKNLPCQRLWSFSVLYDGSVRLCGCRLKTTAMDDLVVGHVDDGPIKDTVYGKRAAAIRNSFVSNEGMPDVCKDCTMYMAATKKWAKGRSKQC